MLQQHLARTFIHTKLVETGKRLVFWNRIHKAILPRWNMPSHSSWPTTSV